MQEGVIARLEILHIWMYTKECAFPLSSISSLVKTLEAGQPPVCELNTSTLNPLSPHPLHPKRRLSLKLIHLGGKKALVEMNEPPPACGPADNLGVTLCCLKTIALVE